ncbi:class I SAM-dependent methyltransferase [Actinospica durhamensis]|uniref:Class I SAM-dependent methyltransferase n=1 Tax=Actinospica durhamensis TaxID=1508375 RepID=A0A941EK24_9ACTN|nr:class I SAM-dependent methyltransferase [Actinospica durhamensis]MBR7833012.1 class I SAM-dependent methyltransferase [Actinospica durhamensis]
MSFPPPTPVFEHYFELREHLLGPLRDEIVGAAELCAAGRLIYGSPENFSLFGIPAPDMTDKGLRFLGRTVVECSIDAYALPLCEAVAELRAALPGAAEAMVVDLFAGSGNLGYHLGRRLGAPVFAADLDPVVHRLGTANADLLGLAIDLRHCDYRDLLAELSPRGPADTYVVEPPWGPAFTAAGLDLQSTTPPVHEILADIRRSRAGQSCLLVVKTNDQLLPGTMERAFHSATHLRSVTPPPTLPYGANMDFHVFRLDPER